MVRTRRLAAVHAVFVGVIVLAGSSRVRSADPRGTLSEVSLPGGLRAAMAAVHDEAAPDRAQFLQEFIRRTYDAPFRQKDDPREIIVRALVAAVNGPSPANGPDTVPLPLSPEVWVKSVFSGRATAQTLVSSIVQSRDASLLYNGLLSLDDDTRAWLEGQPELVAELAARHALAFSAAAPGIRATSSGLSLPGGPLAEPVWQALVEKGPKQPADFIRALLSVNQGRLAPFFGAMAQMTPQQIRVALNLGSADVSARIDAGRRLAGVFQRIMATRTIEQRAFTRPTLDPALFIAGFAVDDDGQPLVPGTRGLWNVVFDETDDGRPKPSRDDARIAVERKEPVDFSSLCEQVFKGSEGDQRRRYMMVLFAARRLGPLTAATAQDTVDAVRAAGSYPMLTMSLERAHVTDLATFAAAARRASELSAIADESRAVRALAQFQGALAAVVRVTILGGLNGASASKLVASLAAIPVGSHGDYEGRLVRWLTAWIDESASRSVFRVANEGSVEDPFAEFGRRERSMLRMLAGPLPVEPQVTSWEGTKYRIDLARAEAIRLAKALEESPRSDLTSAESLVDAADAFAAPGLTRDQLRLRAQAMKSGERRESGEGGESDQPPRARHHEVLASLQRAAAEGDVRAAAHLVPALRVAADELLARILTEFAYASALGERDGISISAAEAGSRHDFGFRSTQGRPAAWRFPIAGADLLGRWRVGGAMLALDLGLSDFSLMPLSHKPPPRKPTLADTDRRGFVEGLALVEPVALTDADRDAIVAAMKRGRARFEAMRTPGDVPAIADAAGLSAARQSLLSWMVVHDAKRVATFLSPVELLWAGLDQTPADMFHAWGASASSRLGCLCLQVVDRRPWEIYAGRVNSGMIASSFPDLNLRLAELLSELHMPAQLLGPVLRSATLDFVNSAISRDFDDRRGLVEFVQALRVDRAELYLGLLTTDGPLVPIGEDSARSSRDGR